MVYAEFHAHNIMDVLNLYLSIVLMECALKPFLIVLGVLNVLLVLLSGVLIMHACITSDNAKDLLTVIILRQKLFSL